MKLIATGVTAVVAALLAVFAFIVVVIGADGGAGGLTPTAHAQADIPPGLLDTYQCANGAADPSRLRDAIWHYNHSIAYVDEVLAVAAHYASLAPAGPAGGY